MPLKRTFSVSESSASDAKRMKHEVKSKRKSSKLVRIAGKDNKRPELKWLQTTPNGAQTALGSCQLLNGCGVGTDNTQRIGRRTSLISCRVKGSLTTGGSNSTVTLALVYDRQPNGALAAYTDIYNVGFTNGNAALPYQDQSDRFVILKSEDFIVSSAGNGNEKVGATVLVDWFVDLKGVDCSFITTGTSIAAIDQGALLLVSLNQLGALMPTQNLITLVKFVDN